MSTSMPPLFDRLPEAFVPDWNPERPWDLLGEPLTRLLEGLLESAIDIPMPIDAHLIGDRIAIGAGTRIYPGVVVEGPIWIGSDVELRPGAYLRPGSYIGDGSIVGTNTEVKRSILLSAVQAPHLSYIGDSILGTGVNLGAGTVLSNFRHDGREIRIPTGSQRISTGRRKLGAVLGDAVLTGCGTVSHPGVVLGRGTQVYTGVQLRSGIYPAQSIIKLKQQLEIVAIEGDSPTAGA